VRRRARQDCVFFPPEAKATLMALLQCGRAASDFRKTPFRSRPSVSIRRRSGLIYLCGLSASTVTAGGLAIISGLWTGPRVGGLVRVAQQLRNLRTDRSLWPPEGDRYPARARTLAGDFQAHRSLSGTGYCS